MIQGFSQPSKLAAVAGPISGVITDRPCREGQSVKRGDCLVSLDLSILHARMELARVTGQSFGELKTAQAELASAKSRQDRIAQLVKRNHATSVELQQAIEAVEIAEANVLHAEERRAQKQAEFKLLKAEANQHHIVAPFDGVLVEYAKQTGEYVGPGDAVVCTLADLDTLSVEFMVPRVYHGEISLDEIVQVAFMASGKTVPGRVENISPYPHGETNTYTVKVLVDNAARKLSAGERCLLQNFDGNVESDSQHADHLTMRAQ